MESGVLLNVDAEDAFIIRMEKSGFTAAVMKMCDGRAGDSLIDYPLPAPFESIRAFFLRLNGQFRKNTRII